MWQKSTKEEDEEFREVSQIEHQAYQIFLCVNSLPSCLLPAFLCSHKSRAENNMSNVIFSHRSALVTRPVSTHSAISSALGSKWQHADWIMLIYELHRQEWMTQMASQMHEIVRWRVIYEIWGCLWVTWLNFKSGERCIRNPLVD